MVGPTKAVRHGPSASGRSLRSRPAAAVARAFYSPDRRGPWSSAPARTSPAEQGQLGIGMGGVEGDDVGEGAGAHRRRSGGEIGVQIRLQLVSRTVNSFCPISPRLLNSLISTSVAPCARSTWSAASKPGRCRSRWRSASLRASALSEPDRVPLRSRGDSYRPRRGRIGGVAAGDGGEDQSRVAHRPGHRPRRVLAVADRNDMGPADQADGGLKPTIPLIAAGQVIEPSVSVPIAAGPSPPPPPSRCRSTSRRDCG